MTVQGATRLLRTDEEIALYDVDINAWRTGVVTKEYIPPVYLDWEVVALQTEMDGSTPILEFDIRPNEEAR